ncbi:MAG TPA: hypothetical protein VH933_04305 [Aestuariivirgaceae bacterium]
MTPKIHVICSDQARNGKTLLSRIIADELTLIGREPMIFDAEFPSGGIRLYLPERTRLVDLGKIGGRMAMIDTILGTSPRDYVIDLPCRLLVETFKLLEQIDFIVEARKAGFSTIVLFIIDRQFSSLRAARQVYNGGQFDRYVPVRNLAVGHVSDFSQVHNLYGEIAEDGEIVLSLLERSILNFLEQRGFSFSAFMMNHYDPLPHDIRRPLRSFLNDVFAQLRDIHGRIEVSGLRRMGLV